MENENQIYDKYDSLSSEGLSRKENWKWRLPMDFAIFLSFFANNFTSILYQNQVINLTCSTTFGFNTTICEKLGTPSADQETKEVEKIVQPYSANIMMAKSIIDHVIPAILGLFLGAWSDKFGRKPILVSVFIGFLITQILGTIITITSSYYSVEPWLYLIPSIPILFFGGVCTLLCATYSYIADITTVEERPMQLALLGMNMALSAFLGGLASGFTIESTNPTIVFIIGTGISVLSVVSIVFTAESLSNDQIEQSSRLRGLFQWEIVLNTLKAFIRRRSNKDRMIVWICMAVSCSYVFAVTEGPNQILYLFVRDKFSWTTKDFTTYMAINLVSLGVGAALAIVILQRWLKLSMPLIAIIGIIFAIADTLIKTFTTTAWLLYMSLGITTAKGVSIHICRSLISHVIPTNETGQIYAVLTAFDYITPLISAPLFTVVYNSTITTFSGAYNLVGFAVLFISFVLIIILYIMDLRQSIIKRNSKEDT